MDMTTKGLTGTKKLCLVFLVGDGSGHAAVFESAFRRANLDVEIIKLPHFGMSQLTWTRLKSLKKLLREKRETRFLIFSPGTTELFLNADHMIVFSAYRPWYRQEKMTVIPHLWTPIPFPGQFEYFKWNKKPPLRIGFMGRSHSTSRLSSALIRSPNWMKEWFLRGTYLKYPMIVALMNELGIRLTNTNTFARMETLNVLSAKKSLYKQAELDIVQKISFSGYKPETQEYVDHLQRNTYVICPRGVENYSFRAFEALNFGRIPVIVDTDIVLPKGIDWDRLSIIIPYSKIDQIYDRILEDYESRSALDFLDRQQIAFATMADLHSMEWVTDFVNRFSPSNHTMHPALTEPV